MISGYSSDMYDSVLKNWHNVERKSNAEGGSIRNEVLWMNFEPIGQLKLDVI